MNISVIITALKPLSPFVPSPCEDLVANQSSWFVPCYSPYNTGQWPLHPLSGTAVARLLFIYIINALVLFTVFFYLCFIAMI